MLWLRVPEKVYIKKGCMPVALRELKDVMGRKRAFIVTDTESYKSGRTAPVERLLDCINIQHTSFYEIDGEVTLCNIQSGAKAAALFEPDVIIAVGGGSAMDGAKLIRIMYEVPDTDIKALSERFCDIRKREELFPRTNVKAALVTVPAASGTGEEVTPYAAFYDDEKRYVIADYEVMPEFAVVDPDFMITQTREEIAAAASAAMVNIISAYESKNSTEYTDGFVIKALANVIGFLPSYIENGSNDPYGCEKLAQASCMAGMAYANTEHISDAAYTVSELADRAEKGISKDNALLERYAELGAAVGIEGGSVEERAYGIVAKIKEMAELLA